MSSSSTFLSYIDDQAFNDGKSPDRLKSVLPQAEDTLLEGEIECAFCEECSFGFSFLENSFGRIVCTNFRLRFDPVARSESDLPARFRTFNERFDIPLCSIYSVSYAPVRQNAASFKRKFLPLTTSLSSLEIVSCIRLHLKDFRIATIDLRGSQNSVSLLNQILFFSRPLKLDNIVQAGAEVNWRGKLMFNDASSWNAELRRCGHQRNDYWRVCSQYPSGARHFVHSYPMHFVVPSEIVQYDLDRMAEHWQQSRFPVWVWSSKSCGTSLLRSSNFVEKDNWEVKGLIDKVIKCVARATRGDHQPHSILLDSEVTTSKIAVSYDRLRRCCSAESYEQYASRDKDWLARINQSGWLQLVGYCMSMAAKVVDCLMFKKRSVIIRETDGLDFSAVVSSISQICCDRYFRCLEGLDILIAKDWISLGHPFAQRLYGIADGVSEVAFTPTFLLFLDCLAQLIRIYPTQFAYSHHALIALWDLSLTGMVPAFSASSAADQLVLNLSGGPFPLERFFHSSYTRLFANVTHFGTLALEKASGSSLIHDVLQPPTTIVDIQLWSECYLRWIPAANILRGGEVISGIALKDVIGDRFPATESLLSEMGPLDVDEKVSSAYPYSVADVTHKGYFAIGDDSLSTSTMSLSMSSSQYSDERWKHRASVPVLGGIPERDSSLSRGEQKSSSTARSFRVRYTTRNQNSSIFE